MANVQWPQRTCSNQVAILQFKHYDHFRSQRSHPHNHLPFPFLEEPLSTFSVFLDVTRNTLQWLRVSSNVRQLAPGPHLPGLSLHRL